MRPAVVALLLAGCRLRFDALADGATGPDEDGDGVPDAVDRCPGTPDPAQADSDNDGVGDACDPSPSTPGDRVALFLPFDGTSLPAGWSTYGTGSWSAANGDVEVTTSDTSSTALYSPIDYAARLAIDLAFRIDAVDMTSPNGFSASAIDGLTLGNLDSEKCGIDDPQNLTIGHEQGGSTVNGVSLPWPGAWLVGGDYTLRMVHAAQLDCTATIGTDSKNLTAPPYIASAGRIGIRVRSANIAFHYLVLYTH